MFRRRTVLTVLLLISLFAMLGARVLWVTAASRRINKVTFDAIELGTTREQIEALVGIVPGDYSTSDDLIIIDTALDGIENKQKQMITRVIKGNVLSDSQMVVWLCDTSFLFVHLNHDGIAYRKEFYPVSRPPHCLLNILRDMSNRQETSLPLDYSPRIGQEGREDSR